MTHRFLKWLVAGATLVVLAAFVAGGAFAGSAPAKPDVMAGFTTDGSVAPEFLANARTIPHWTFTYTDPTNGVSYPITMVGPADDEHRHGRQDRARPVEVQLRRG